jgi:hypothetical protein
MKNVSKFLIIVIFLFFTQVIIAQEEPDEPEVPEEPKVNGWAVPNVDIEFDEFPFYKMSEKDEQELLKNIKSSLKDELKIIKDKNLNKYFELLRESQFKNQRFPFMAKREKRMHEREKRIFESEIMVEALATKYENASESEKERIKRDLRSELEKLFDQKEERRKEEVEELQKELKELQKSLAIRQKNKKEIIERRVQELLNEDHYLDWD